MPVMIITGNNRIINVWLHINIVKWEIIICTYGLPYDQQIEFPKFS